MGAARTTRTTRTRTTGTACSPATGSHPSGHLPLRAVRALREMALWSLPARVRRYVLAVDVLAVVVCLPLLHTDQVHGRQLLVLGLLAAGSVVHVEVARAVEQLREAVGDKRPYVDLKSVWTFAAMLLLPLGPALALVVFTFVWSWFRVASRPVIHRWIFSMATVLLATVASSTVLSLVPVGPTVFAGFTGLLAVSLAALVRWAVNWVLVCGVFVLMAPTARWRDYLIAPVETLLALSSLALGGMVAALASIYPWLTSIVLVPMIVMHRGLLFQVLLERVHTDARTGLATATRWRMVASRALDHARRRGLHLGVLMLDLDEFKHVNDTYGHLAGDRVLRAMGTMLTDEVPTHEAVGRLGGEEFAVLLEGTTPAAVAETAERLRRRTTELVVEAGPSGREITGLSVSVGTALGSDLAAADLDDLLLAADAALYDAKRTGRNRVCGAPGTTG